LERRVKVLRFSFAALLSPTLDSFSGPVHERRIHGPEVNSLQEYDSISFVFI